MKILIATGLYPPEIGGPATYAHMLETELPARSIEVKVVPFGWVRHYPKMIRHIVFAWKLYQEAKGYDVMYALDPISVGLPASLIAKITKKTFLIRLGGDYAWEQGRVRFGLTDSLDDYLAQMDKAPLAVRVLARLQTYVCNRASRIILPSEYLRSVILRWGIEKEKTHVIYSALYPLEVTDSKEELRRGLSFTSPTIVSAGRLVPWKGFAALIEAVQVLKEEFPEITLVIAGDGGERENLEALVARLGLKEQVRFAGSVSKSALGATIKAADVFVLNTAYEGLSHQLLEVMELGVPVVTTTAGGNPELITDQIHGRLIEYNHVPEIVEAVKSILVNKDTANRYITAARGRANDFSKSKVVEQFVEFIKRYE